MSNRIHLANSRGRDATVGMLRLKGPAGPKFGLPGQTLAFRRFVAATESGTHSALSAEFGTDYGQHLVDGDPEIDVELVGQFVDSVQQVYIDGEGAVLRVDPRMVEVLSLPDGSEKERRSPVETVGNVDEPDPVRWTGRKISIPEAVRRFAFKRRMQLVHTDGLTFDFLYEMAAELESSDCLMLLGTGSKGTGPLVFQANGRPYRGFLHGTVRPAGAEATRRAYRLVLLLSELELKPPAPSKPVQSKA
jgi:hypothetical protein